MSLKTALSTFFSKPAQTHRVGLCIGQASLSLGVYDDNNTVTLNEVPLPLNLGQTLKAQDASKAINGVLVQWVNEHKVSGTCHLILPASHYQIVQIDKPNVPEAEINAALKWQIKDLVTIAVDDMIVDYFDGPFVGSSQKLNVVCASKMLLSSIAQTLEDTSMELTIISTEEFAFASLVEHSEDAVLLVCQQPNQEILLLIVMQGKLFFHRRLRGFAKIAEQAPEQLTSYTVDNLSLEIQRSTDYFERQLKQAPIKSIKVIVPIEHETLLVEALAKNTLIPVELLSLPEGEASQRSFAAVLGASKLNILGQQ